MELAALKHVARVSLEMMGPDAKLIIVGSSSLLATFPELGEEGGLLGSSYDADIVPLPFEDEIGIMLHESLGEDRRFHQIHGYCVDVLRPKIGEQFPADWESRLLPLPDVPRTKCLEPHDLAVAKCRTGREKDFSLLISLAKAEKIDLDLVKIRMRNTTMIESEIVVAHKNLQYIQNSLDG